MNSLNAGLNNYNNNFINNLRINAKIINRLETINSNKLGYREKYQKIVENINIIH